MLRCKTGSLSFHNFMWIMAGCESLFARWERTFYTFFSLQVNGMQLSTVEMIDEQFSIKTMFLANMEQMLENNLIDFHWFESV